VNKLEVFHAIDTWTHDTRPKNISDLLIWDHYGNLAQGSFGLAQLT